jgi:hypothetical protein
VSSAKNQASIPAGNPVREQAVAPPHSVAIFNPLPNVLHHYVRELQETLERCGVSATLYSAPGVEGVRGVVGKLRLLLSHVRAVRAAAKSDSVIICVWPVLGWYELELWSVGGRRSAGENLVIFHDPTPLRSQIGLNRRSARIASLLSRRGLPAVATHSSNAAQIVHDLLGVKPIHLLHPILTEAPTPRSVAQPRPPRVGVFGQYKPSRDVELLSSLPSLLEGYDLRMAGTGWPRLDGWNQNIQFLTEDQLTCSIGEVDVVLIPYTTYYQSGVAVRAMELGIPVAGAMTPFLHDLYGDDFPGVVVGSSNDDWVTAINRSVGMPVERSRRDYQLRVDGGWRHWLFGV